MSRRAVGIQEYSLVNGLIGSLILIATKYHTMIGGRIWYKAIRCFTIGGCFQRIWVPSTQVVSHILMQSILNVHASVGLQVIFDCELSPGQLRNLERAFGGGGESGGVRVSVT
jgi:hypothetical protein